MFLLSLAGGALAAPAVLRAQGAWKPTKPITIYNPLAAGGVCDVHLRFLGERVSRQFGQQVIVDIKAGAGATLGGRANGEHPAGRLHDRLHDHQQPALPALSDGELASAA